MTDAPSSLREAFLEIRELWDQASRKDLLNRYQIGFLIDEAMSDRNKYGEEVVVRLAAMLDASSDVLYGCRRIAQTWELYEIQCLRKRMTVHGRRIAFTHLVLIASVMAPKERKRLIDEFFSKDLTVRELTERVRQFTGKPKRPDRIRPGTPSAGLNAMQRIAESYVEKCTVWREVVFDVIEEAITTERDITHLEAMRETKKSQELIKERVEQNIERLDKCIRFANEVREETRKANHLPKDPTPARPSVTKRRAKTRTPANT